jgi:signal peptidase I
MYIKSKFLPLNSPIFPLNLHIYGICRASGDIWVLTKGDNNNGHDRSLYARGQEWLRDKDILGRIIGYFPYLGWATIGLNDFPQLKYALFAILSFVTLTSRE